LLGALWMTFLAPASRCFWQVSWVRNRPVRLDDHVGTDVAPLQRRRVALGAQSDAPAVDDQRRAVDRDLALEAAVHAVVLQHVGQVVGLEQVVDADDLDVGEVLHGGTEDHAPDAAEAVDADADAHCVLLVGLDLERGPDSTWRTVSATFCAVKWKCWNSAGAGALSP
jgi:hypothetical protein